MSSPQNNLEQDILDRYGGKSNEYLPQSLLFDHVSPATRLLEKRRQMFEVDDALVSQKQEFTRREEAFHRREDGLRRKDLDLQESLIKFNKFLRENEAKRVRALKKASEEKKISELKDIEIQQLNTKLSQLYNENEKINQELDKYLKYREYIEDVVSEGSKYFHEISDVLNRYKILKDTNTYLLEKQANDEEMSDMTRSKHIQLKKAKETNVLNINNKMIEMHTTLENKHHIAYKLQNKKEKESEIGLQKLLLLGEMIRSIAHLHERCHDSNRQASGTTTTTNTSVPITTTTTTASTMPSIMNTNTSNSPIKTSSTDNHTTTNGNSKNTGNPSSSSPHVIELGTPELVQYHVHESLARLNYISVYIRDLQDIKESYTQLNKITLKPSS